MKSEVAQINKTATIAINESLSGAVDLEAYRLVGIRMPTGWDAADLTFQGSDDGVTYYVIYEPYVVDVKVRVKTAASRKLIFNPGDFAGVRYLKIQSETSAGVAVTQTAERALILQLQPLAI